MMMMMMMMLLPSTLHMISHDKQIPRKSVHIGLSWTVRDDTGYETGVLHQVDHSQYTRRSGYGFGKE